MVEQSNQSNIQNVKERITKLSEVPENELDSWCEDTIKSVLNVYKGKRTHLLLKLITDEIRPAKTFEPEPQPQDTADLLAELIQLFLGEVNEISDVVNSINKE